jgi:hypothetical protein
MAQIDRLNTKIVTMVPSGSVAQEHSIGLTRELEYISPNEETHENINNPWATTNGDQWSSPPQRMNTVDLFEQEQDTTETRREFTWEADIHAKSCRLCTRKFGLISRRHHCRRCGLVVCDKCSPYKVFLNPSEILQDPEGTLESTSILASHHQRICEKCHFDIQQDN